MLDLVDLAEASTQAGASTGVLLQGVARKAAEETIKTMHYTRSVPSGKSYYIAYGEALVVFSMPANYFAARHFMPGVADAKVFELTRLWAPDGHAKNLLTQAISVAIGVLRRAEPNVDLVVSYADPSAGHHGGVYKAGSWIETGRSEEVRAWRIATAARSCQGEPFTAAAPTSTNPR